MLKAPSLTNKYYISTGWKRPPGPGYNRCITYVDGYCLPNCVGYAYGRFMEIAGVKECSLSRANAKDWYPHTSDGYERGQKPKVGAVMCWRTRGKYGHVAIVEEVYPDGSVLISESADCGDDVMYNPSNSRHWKTQKVSCKNYTYPSPYANFQGFIYNPYYKSSQTEPEPEPQPQPEPEPEPEMDITRARTDAMVRVIAYLNSLFEPSINVSRGPQISRINYDTAYNFIQMISGEDPKKIEKRVITVMMMLPRIIIEYLMQHGLTIAAGVGICANMYADSQLSAEAKELDSQNHPIAFGLCMWSGSRATSLQKYKDWTALSVQLDFLLHELKTVSKFSSLYSDLKETEDPNSATTEFANTYYDKSISDLDFRLKVCDLLWSCTKVIVE